MKEWHSEDEIKAQLRELTDETRKLRNELHALIRPSKSGAPRGFIHDRGKLPSPELPVHPERKRR